MLKPASDFIKEVLEKEQSRLERKRVHLQRKLTETVDEIERVRNGLEGSK